MFRRTPAVLPTSPSTRSLVERLGAPATAADARERASMTFDSYVAAGAAIPLRKVFDFQSYFDTTQLQNALLPQLPTEPIVQSSIGNDGNQQLRAWGFGNHPASQVPIAIQPLLADGKSGGPTLVLKPGEVAHTGSKHPFAGFTWGLPFGWLGGGAAQLLAFQTQETVQSWNGNPELIFHRMRQPLFTNVATPPLYANWPMRFPWMSGARYLSAGVTQPQNGLPFMGVEPTKTFLRLRTQAAVAGGNAVRMIAVQTDDLDLTSTGSFNAVNVDASFEDVYFPTLAPDAAFTIGGLNPAQYPVIEVPPETLRFGGDECGVYFVDLANAYPSPTFIDVIRYGKL